MRRFDDSAHLADNLSLGPGSSNALRSAYARDCE